MGQILVVWLALTLPHQLRWKYTSLISYEYHLNEAASKRLGIGLFHGFQ